MKRALFDIWEDVEDTGSFSWRAQLVNYVGYFVSRNAAERFVDATKKAREQDAKRIKSK